jgi:hypothetical protein
MTDRPVEELLEADKYTEEELSDITGIGIDVIRRAAHIGQLRAETFNDQIIAIRREDALEWMRTRP